jgi:hypothetical protein
LELIVSGNEVCFAVDFNEGEATLPSFGYLANHETFRCSAASFFAGSSSTFLSQDFEGFIKIAK